MLSGRAVDAAVISIVVGFALGVAACNDKYSNYCDRAEEDNEVSAVSDTEYSSARRWKRSPSPEDPLAAFQPFRSERVLSGQISSILDQLFNSGYNQRIRPGLGGPPLDVEINVAVRSVGPVDEQRQVFSIDCYFRQYWTDPRLKYNSTRLKELPMNWAFLTKIWRPDTYIVNGKQSYLHKMTVPNRFIRIAPNGRISYSQRLTIKARCQMDLRKFPLDSQQCPLEFGSFGHGEEDLIYRWGPNPVSIDSNMGLAQYDLVNWTYSSFNGLRGRAVRNVSLVQLTFQFQRQTGFYMLQIYIPLTLIVCCSWVTFWLRMTGKGTEIAGRTSLGASSVLSIVTLGFGGKSKPEVGHATALDVFIILCFTAVFAAMVEFAFLNFLDTLVRRLRRKDKEHSLVRLMAQHNVRLHGRNAPELPLERQESVVADADIINIHACDDDEEEEEDDAPPASAYKSNGILRQGRVDSEADEGCYLRFVDLVLATLERFNCCRPIRAMRIYSKPHTVINGVDQCSRKMFPCVFLLLNFAYWGGYMYVF